MAVDPTRRQKARACLRSATPIPPQEAALPLVDMSLALGAPGQPRAVLLPQLLAMPSPPCPDWWTRVPTAQHTLPTTAGFLRRQKNEGESCPALLRRNGPFWWWPRCQLETRGQPPLWKAPQWLRTKMAETQLRSCRVGPTPEESQGHTCHQAVYSGSDRKCFTGRAAGQAQTPVASAF